MRSPTAGALQDALMETAASAKISAGGAGWSNTETLLVAVAWLERLLCHQDALSLRISGCPRSCARSQLNSRLHRSHPFRLTGRNRKEQSHLKGENAPFNLCFLLFPADVSALSSPRISAPSLAPLCSLNACPRAPMKTMVVYNSLLLLCLQLPFQTPGTADVRVLHLGSSHFYLVLMPSMSSRNADHKASWGRGGPGRVGGRQG